MDLDQVVPGLQLVTVILTFSGSYSTLRLGTDCSILHMLAAKCDCISDAQTFGPKYPENTEKIPPKYQKRLLLVFFRYFLGIPEFRPAGYFFGIFCGNSGSGHLGALEQVGVFSTLAIPGDLSEMPSVLLGIP